MASVSISCPSCSATDGVVRNGKSTAGHQRHSPFRLRNCWEGRSVRASSLLRQLAKG
ncbi:IS1 family transposase, partial [Marinobacter sp. F3R08]|uniref:IS1 family transposase n=1 Tax=Marinobacter sp. F3R08 TaxID=2841559 RepID=UPI003A4D6B55